MDFLKIFDKFTLDKMRYISLYIWSDLMGHHLERQKVPLKLALNYANWHQLFLIQNWQAVHVSGKTHLSYFQTWTCSSISVRKLIFLVMRWLHKLRQPRSFFGLCRPTTLAQPPILTNGGGRETCSNLLLHAIYQWRQEVMPHSCVKTFHNLSLTPKTFRPSTFAYLYLVL